MNVGDRVTVDLTRLYPYAPNPAPCHRRGKVIWISQGRVSVRLDEFERAGIHARNGEVTVDSFRVRTLM